MKRTVFINILVLCALVLIVEIGGQLYSRWAYGMSLAERTAQYRRDAQDSVTVFERHPYLVATPKRSVSIGRAGASISTTPMRTRVTGLTPPKPGAITVALVGGSTTFGTKVTDADSWPWLLQEKLGNRYAVINYGVPGYTTAEKHHPDGAHRPGREAGNRRVLRGLERHQELSLAGVLARLLLARADSGGHADTRRSR